MAKHRLEQPHRGRKLATKAVIAGSILGGSLAVTAGPATAAPIHVPNIGTFEIPGLTDDQIPNELKPKAPGEQSGPGILAPQPSANEQAARAAESKIGSPYSYGAAGPDAFDCSGLIYWSYQQVGKTIPRDSYGQMGGGQGVSYDNVQVGDVLIFNGGGHAGIYVGGGNFVHSSNYGTPVKSDPVSEWSLTSVRRF